MQLSELEIDILGDMQFDAHELWEWYSFIRSHHPDMAEDEVIKLGYSMFKKWVARGWLVFYISRKFTTKIDPVEFIKTIEKMGKDAGNPQHPSIVLELSEKAYKENEWIKK